MLKNIILGRKNMNVIESKRQYTYQRTIDQQKGLYSRIELG